MLVFALAALVPSWIGWLSGAERPRSRLPGTILVAALDAQLLAGLLLYFALSPMTRSAPGGSRPTYWAFIHPLFGLAAIVLAHFGQALSKRARDARSADRRAALFFGAAALAIAVTTPWPFLPMGRPLWPF